MWLASELKSKGKIYLATPTIHPSWLVVNFGQYFSYETLLFSPLLSFLLSLSLSLSLLLPLSSPLSSLSKTNYNMPAIIL